MCIRDRLGHGALVGLAAQAGDGGYTALDGAQDLPGGVIGRSFGQALSLIHILPALKRSYSRAVTLPMASTGVRPRSRSAGATP